VVKIYSFYKLSDKRNYVIITLSNSFRIAAIAQTFILGVPSKVAANWFPQKERAKATSIGALFNQVSLKIPRKFLYFQLGIAIGFLMGPAIVTSTDKIATLLLVDAILCSGKVHSHFFLTKYSRYAFCRCFLPRITPHASK
jgi:hypothetical protein